MCVYLSVNRIIVNCKGVFANGYLGSPASDLTHLDLHNFGIFVYYGVFLDILWAMEDLSLCIPHAILIYHK